MNGPDPATETTHPVPRERARRVLLVDDDAIQRNLVRAQLEAAGFSVETACGADAALEAVRSSRPDAILSDVLMDDIDGFALCRMLRRDPALADAPIVLISAYFNETDDRELAREVGATALVERSTSIGSDLERLLHGLAADRAAPVDPDTTYGLHVRRVAHQLARFRDDSARSAKRYLALFENANDAISIVTHEGVVVDVNRRWEEIMQRPRAELVGLHVRDFVASDLTAFVEERYRQAARVEHGRHEPIRISGARGEVVMEFTTTAIDVDGAQRVLLIGRDVTELVQSQRALAASEERYRSLLESIPEVVWSATTRHELLYMSANAHGITGYTPQELIEGVAGPIDRRVHPDDLASFHAAFAALVERRQPLDLEFRWQHRDGRWIWIHGRAVLARHPDGVEYVDGVLSDVTERHLVEDQLFHAQKIEALGELTAGIAHDFNNILAIVLANADLLTGLVEEGEARTIAEEILHASERGTVLTSRLLAFARREPAPLSELDLGEVLRGLEPLVSRALGPSVSLTVRTPASSAVRVVPSEIEQLIMNLAVNARDAMPDGGTLTMEVADVEAPHEAPLVSGRWVALTVRDTGTGMEKATKKRIFEPFFTTKGAGKGTGLGLSIAYGVVRRHAAHMTVDSAPNAGTTFRVYFPVASPDEARASATTRPRRSTSIGLDR